MRRETERDIFRYIDFLRDVGYTVAFSCFNTDVLKESVLSMTSYESHLNDVCLYLKSRPETCDKCIRNKEILIGAKKEILYNCCWAGVEEYVFPIICYGQLICRVHISGYRGTLRKSIRRSRVVAKQRGKSFTELYALLKNDVPTQNSVERLIMPLYYMFDKLCKDSLSEPTEADPLINLYRRALWYIYDHFAENIQTETIAHALNYSPSHLRAVFRKFKGSTVMEYVNNVRMDHAGKLLRFTKLPITKIAYECGFRDGNYFSTAFKKFYHVPPSKYRQRRKI